MNNFIIDKIKNLILTFLFLSYIALKNVPICQTYATPLTYVKMESGHIEPVLILIGLTLSKGGAARLFSKRIKMHFLVIKI